MESKLEKQKRKAEKLSNPKPTLLKSGKWRCQIMYNGKRYSVIEDSPELAHTKALAIKNGLIEEETKLENGNMTVGDAINRYIEIDCATLESSTVNNYKSIRRNNLQSLMSIKISDLTSRDVQIAINSMAKNHSPKTVRNAHALFTAAMSVYYPEYRDSVVLPKMQKKEIEIPTNEQVEQILKAAAGDRAEIPIMFGALLGLRLSEIRGLTWDCIKNGRIHIKQAIVKGENGDYLKKTKTYDSDRWLTLPEVLVERLNKEPHTSEFITTMSGRKIYGHFVKICSDLGLPKFRFHDLRHYTASVMLALNIPHKYAQKRMGHSTDYMLKHVYEHLMTDKEIEVDEEIENFFALKLHTELHTKN